ncbi:MAG: hypothetical protein IKT27_00075 [Clostridia bacterium]|nr:hypothetical protein [Clostridia bacterium]
MEIKTDTYFIGERLREVDGGYYVVYEEERGRYEVHHREGKPTTFCVAVPYDTLDERTITLVQKTRIENLEKILDEIDKANAKLEKTRVKNTLEKLKELNE